MPCALNSIDTRVTGQQPFTASSHRIVGVLEEVRGFLVHQPVRVLLSSMGIASDSHCRCKPADCPCTSLGRLPCFLMPLICCRATNSDCP